MKERNLHILRDNPIRYGLLIFAGLLVIFTASLVSLVPASADGGGGFPTATRTATFFFFATPTITSTPIVIQQLEVFPPTNTALSPQALAPQPSSPNLQGAAPAASPSSGLPLWLFPIFIIIAAIVLLMIFSRILRRR